MPKYEFVCPLCDYKQEQLFLVVEEYFDNPEKIKCESCGTTTKKIFSRISHIVFKGSGFYCTENRRRINEVGKWEEDDGQVTVEDARQLNDRERITENNYVPDAEIMPIEGDLVTASATI